MDIFSSSNPSTSIPSWSKSVKPIGPIIEVNPFSFAYSTTLSNKALSNYVRYKVNVTYEKVEEIATLKAQQVIEEKSDTINDKIVTKVFFITAPL